MPSVNHVVIAGNLTRKPDLRYTTTSGKPVVRLGLAINHKWTGEGGEAREEVVFVDVDAWGGTAEACARYLDTGSPVLVEGRLRLDQWDDNGTKRSKLGVVAESVQFLGAAPKPDKGQPGWKPEGR